MEQRINQILQIATLPTNDKELPVQEYRPPKTTEEEEFELAISHGKISGRPEEELKQALRYVFILVGLKAQNYPVDLEKQMLHAYIYKNYGGHTPEEIKLAWEMAIQNKLDLEPKEVICYENFSIAYFTRIMEAFRLWSREQIKRIHAPRERIVTKEEKAMINLSYAGYLLNILKQRLLPPLK